jgi:hypothetical protein
MSFGRCTDHRWACPDEEDRQMRTCRRLLAAASVGGSIILAICAGLAAGRADAQAPAASTAPGQQPGEPSLLGAWQAHAGEACERGLVLALPSGFVFEVHRTPDKFEIGRQARYQVADGKITLTTEGSDEKDVLAYRFDGRNVLVFTKQGDTEEQRIERCF